MAPNKERESAEHQIKGLNSLETRRTFLKKVGIGTAGAAALWVAPQMTSVHSRPAYASITGANPRRCVVLFDQDTIDNDMYSFSPELWPSIEGIAAAHTAAGHPTTSAHLVNEADPVSTTGYFPALPAERWLNWNRDFTDDPNCVLLPGGNVDDEGVFTLPDASSAFLKNFLEGNLDPDGGDLDPIKVCALRNNSLRSMIGMDCIGVVYDDGINVDHTKMYNLEREISGLFRFRVKGVLRPGNGVLSEGTGGVHSEADDSNHLLSLWLKVLPCVDNFDNLFSHPSIDGTEPPDGVAITVTGHDGTNVIVEATSTDDPVAVLNVSIGRTDELEDQSIWPRPMPWNGSVYRAEFEAPASVIDGKIVLVSSSHGGSANEVGSA